jgi:hypothetical protein
MSRIVIVILIWDLFKDALSSSECTVPNVYKRVTGMGLHFAHCTFRQLAGSASCGSAHLMVSAYTEQP